jgi:hypothetical protein
MLPIRLQSNVVSTKQKTIQLNDLQLISYSASFYEASFYERRRPQQQIDSYRENHLPSTLNLHVSTRQIRRLLKKYS